MKPRRRARTLAQGLVYDEGTRTAKISIYVEGRKGIVRIRRTVHDVSKDEAMQVHASLRAKANRGREKPSAVAPTFQTFFDAYFELIAERISPSTASSYRQTAERYLLPRFGAWRLSDITAGAVNVWLLELKRASCRTSSAARRRDAQRLREHPARDRELFGPLRRDRGEPVQEGVRSREGEPTEERAVGGRVRRVSRRLQ